MNVVQRIAQEFNTIHDVIYSTLPPTLSYDASVLEQTEMQITVNNYDSGFTYNVTGTNLPAGSSLSQVVDGVITFTSGVITGGDVAISINVTAEDTVNGLSVSPAGVANINIIDLNVIDDTTDSVGVNDGVLLYQGADMSSTYITEVADDTTRIDNNKIKTSAVAYSALAYAGNGTSQDLNLGIEANLNGRLVAKKGGLNWTKNRSGTNGHKLVSTLFGPQATLESHSVSVLGVTNDTYLKQFNSNGYSIGSNGAYNASANNFVSWNNQTEFYTNGYTNHDKYYELEINPDTGFFQGVFEGSGLAGHEIPHLMGVAPSFFAVKSLEAVHNWFTYNSASGATKYQYMNLTSEDQTGNIAWNDTEPTTNVFTLGTSTSVNETGLKHYFYGYVNVAGKVKVGSYVGTGSSGNIITGLGFQPSRVTIKRTNAVGNWVIMDSKRGDTSVLFAESSGAETTQGQITFDADGFTVNATELNVNGSGDTFLYIAIADHEGHETTLYTGNGATKDIMTGLNMNVDDGSGSLVEIDRAGGMFWGKNRSVIQNNVVTSSLMRKHSVISTNSTANDTNWVGREVDFLDNGIRVKYASDTTSDFLNGAGSNYASWNFPTTKYISGYTNHGMPFEVEYNPVTGFCQGVFVGSGITGHEIQQGLSSQLDFLVIKPLDIADNWRASINGQVGELNTTNAFNVSSLLPHSVGNFTIYTTDSGFNGNGTRYYFFGFANTTGKVKVGTYVGTGAAGNSITGVGFQPTFIMNKAISTTGNWNLFDSKREDVNGRLYANLTNAEETSTDILTIDADGFTLNGNFGDNNASGVTYFYIAIDDSAMETILYTGNGSTQDVITGLDMKRAVTYPEIPGAMGWIKSLGLAVDHAIYDTVRGALKEIKSSATAAELDRTDTVLKFNANGLSLGAGSGVNTNADSLIAWMFGTTHEYRGVTNHGKPYHIQWNLLSGYVQVKYTGSGTAGHQIPTHLGKALDLSLIKSLDSVTDWIVHGGINMNDGLRLNTTAALSNTVDDVVHDNGSVELLAGVGSYVNVANEEYILYGWANSMTQEVIEYDGTGTAGNFVKTKKKPAYVMTKRLDSTSDWRIADNERTSFDDIISANTSGAEFNQTNITIHGDGFNVIQTGTGNNASGGRYLAFVIYETDEDTLGAKYYG